MKRKKTDVVQLKLRLVEDLRKRLEIAAESEKRSLNSEIIARLEDSFVQAGTRLETILEKLSELLGLMRSERERSLLENLFESPTDAPVSDKEAEERFRAALDARMRARPGQPQLVEQPELPIDRRAPRSGELNLAPIQAAHYLCAALGRPLRGNELDVAMEEPDSALGRLLRAQVEKAAPPDNEPELPMPAPRRLSK
jgi:hypothetical protein